MAEALIQPAWEIGKCSCAPIGKRISYVRKLSANLGKLCTKLESELVPKKNDIVAQIERLDQQKKPIEECVAWRKAVEEMEDEIETIKLKVKKRCLCGLCPNIYAREKLGKRVEEMILEIDDLLCRSKFENGYLVDPPPDPASDLLASWEALCEKASELCIRRKDVVDNIERLNQQKKPTEAYVAWKKAVVEMEDKIEARKREVNAEIRPDDCACMELRKQVEDMIREIQELLDRSKSGNEFLVDPPPAKVERQPDSASKLTSSAHHTLDKVLDKVRDRSSPKIGLYGMGGVGKTTVLKLLNNLPELKPLFDVMIWVTVSQSWSIRGLQKQITDRLEIEITTDDSDARVRSKLFQHLDGKKYMLLLDDVWDEVDLSAVGIPDPNQENGCKVVLTTRQIQVCREMRTNDEVPVAVLPPKEAWEMFCSEVGDVATLPTIRSCAEEIVRGCDGLPLALKVVSGALRKQENVHVWRDFSKKLRSPATSFIKKLNEKVFTILKTSYDNLESIEEKNCLLFCGLYPEDSEIDKFELIKYWRAEGILLKELTLAETRDEGETILQGLIDASLLEKSDVRGKCVKMHDLIRDMVLAMTASAKGEEPQQLVRAGISSEKIPDAVDWEKATRISFIDHDLRDLPESPNCPELLTLLLQGNKNLKVIPETFFDNMPKLRVLDLSRTGIKSLPTSVSKLDSLQVLVLLDCKSLKFVPPGVLCSLSQMEVFEWNNRVRRDGNTEIVAKELSCLSSLSSLIFNFGLDSLLHFLENSILWRERRLTQFWFGVGNPDYGSEAIRSYWNNGYSRCLLYQGDGGVFYQGDGGGEESSSYIPSAMVEVLQRSNCFILHGHEKLNSLSALGPYNCIEEGVGMETIINRNRQEMDPFSNLEGLFLRDLPNLKSILSLEMEEGPLLPPPPNTKGFTNLKWLELSECLRIEQLFSSALMVQQLSNLEVLDVSACGLKGMISDDQKLEYEALPKLRSMNLFGLSKLESLFNGVPMRWQSLEDVTITWCGRKIRKLPFNMDSAPNLKRIEGGREWWEALEWDNDAIKLRFQPLFVQD